MGGDATLPEGAADNRFLAAARLVLSRTAPALLEQLRRERRRFAGLEERAFRQGMHAWVEEALLGASEPALELPPFEELEGAKEADMTNVFRDMMDRFIAENRAEGRVEGAVNGQRDLLVAMATRRFGAPAGRHVADALYGQPSPEMIAETSDLIVACETPEELVGSLPK